MGLPEPQEELLILGQTRRRLLKEEALSQRMGGAARWRTKV